MLRLTHPGARAATRARPITSLLLALFSIVACSDSASAPLAPRPPIAEADATPIVASTHPVAVPLSVLLDRLDEERRRGSESRLTGNAIIDGAQVSLSGPDAVHGALARVRDANDPANGGAGPTTFGNPIFAGALQISGVGSAVTVSSGRFDFATYTLINKPDVAEFTHTGTQQVSLVNGNVRVPIWSNTSTHVQQISGGMGRTQWPPFTPSNGCHFAALLTSQHKVVWPIGSSVPGFIASVRSSFSNGANELWRSCTTPPPPPGPAPAPDSPFCDDPSGAGCDTGGGGGGGGTGPYSGGPVEREMGRVGGLKTVCLVTDWFENGVYIETTVDRCWSEPIYR